MTQEESSEELSNFAFRLASRAEKLGLSQVAIGERLGAKKPRVSNWFSAKNFPRAREKVALATLLGVRLEWLIRGEGLPEISSEDQEDSDPHIHRVREVPVVSWSHAGAAATYEEIPKHSQGHVATTSRDRRAFAVIVEGDCMEPKFLPGDHVILEPGAHPRNGKPVVAKLAEDEEVQLRVYTKLPGGRISLATLKPAIYPTVEYHASAFSWIYPVAGMYRGV